MAASASDTVVTASPLEERVVAFAEQLGRVVGTVQARTEGWLDPQLLKRQMATVRDGAADLIDQIANSTGWPRPAKAEPKAAANAAPRGRSGGKVDAPGKRHRKPAPSVAGAKKSDSRIAKMRFADETRRRGTKG